MCGIIENTVVTEIRFRWGMSASTTERLRYTSLRSCRSTFSFNYNRTILSKLRDGPIFGTAFLIYIPLPFGQRIPFSRLLFIGKGP